MKKIALCMIAFVLMISININLYATTEGVETVQDVQNPETQAEIQQEDTNEQVNAKAVVIEVGEVKEIQTGSIMDTVQEVTIEILDGEYETREFTTNYNLSYDIDGKIKGYELEVGDKVDVQIEKNETGETTVTVQNLIRDKYIMILFGVFLLSIILVGGKQGVKAIIGLLITIIVVYFILIKGIYLGYNAILMTIVASAIIIVLTFIVIGGFSKKILTAALGTLGGVISSRNSGNYI